MHKKTDLHFKNDFFVTIFFFEKYLRHAIQFKIILEYIHIQGRFLMQIVCLIALVMISVICLTIYK